MLKEPATVRTNEGAHVSVRRVRFPTLENEHAVRLDERAMYFPPPVIAPADLGLGAVTAWLEASSIQNKKYSVAGVQFCAAKGLVPIRRGNRTLGRNTCAVGWSATACGTSWRRYRRCPVAKTPCVLATDREVLPLRSAWESEHGTRDGASGRPHAARSAALI